MIFSKKFMTDMNEALGPQGWGQYFCEPSLSWFDQVHGDAELPYYVGLNSIKKDSNVPEEERPFWVKTVKLLQSNVQAIKYNDRYVIDGYKITGQGIDLDFDTYSYAVLAFKDLLKNYYTVGDYFECSQILEINGENVYNPLSNLDEIPQNITLNVHSRSGQISTIASINLDSYINDQIRIENQLSMGPYILYQKVKDIDDGFLVLEEIKIQL